eukprot:5001289-Alexandrium_andersonii.AAC.1
MHTRTHTHAFYSGTRAANHCNRRSGGGEDESEMPVAKSVGEEDGPHLPKKRGQTAGKANAAEANTMAS